MAQANVVIIKVEREYLKNKEFVLTVEDIPDIVEALKDEIVPPLMSIGLIQEGFLFNFDNFAIEKVVDHTFLLSLGQTFIDYYNAVSLESERSIHQWYKITVPESFDLGSSFIDQGISLPFIPKDNKALVQYLNLNQVHVIQNTEAPDPWYKAHQHHFNTTNMEFIWDEIFKFNFASKSSTDHVQRLALIDSGVDFSNRELKDQYFKIRGKYTAYDAETKTYIKAKNSDVDSDQHGTAIAGILSARHNKSDGQGSSFHSKLLNIRAFGDGSDSTLLNALAFAVYHKADLINCSWGPAYHRPENQCLKEAIDFAFDKKVLCIFAAGNHGYDVKWYYPMNDERVICVGAINKQNFLLGGTNFGDKDQSSDTNSDGVDVLAPGEDILSLEGIGIKSGTSFAAPQVAGLLALIIELFPNIKKEGCSPATFIKQVKDLLQWIPPGDNKSAKPRNVRSHKPLNPNSRKINAQESHEYAEKYQAKWCKGKSTSPRKSSRSKKTGGKK